MVSAPDGAASLSHSAVCEGGVVFSLPTGRLSASLARSSAPSRSQAVFPMEREDEVLGRLWLRTRVCVALWSGFPLTGAVKEEGDQAVSQGVVT